MVALLETLKNAMRDFAAREEKMNSDFRARSAVETRAFDTAKAKRLADLEEESAKSKPTTTPRRIRRPRDSTSARRD